jgi:YidC/Oxa1 family membrane protein insertase
MISMRKMQQIQPEIMALKDNYKDNPKQMNVEMMAIYHRNNINPLSGCLPMILQMPVFIGLYQVLWRDASFKGQNFLWIKDLSDPDRLFVFSNKIPLIGHDFNILPIFMAIIMFFQQKINMKNVVVVDENQLLQQKMMMYLMPILMGFIFYNFSSGLTLYFVVFYLMSLFTQLKFNLSINKKS